MANLLFTYVIITIVLISMLTVAGIPTTASFAASSLGLIDGFGDFKGSTIFLAISAIFASVAVGGIVVSFFTKQSPDSYLTAGAAALMLALVNDWIAVYNVMNGLVQGSSMEWLKYVVQIPFAALVGGYLIVIVNWWRGSD